jgi:hypothetical protein
MIVTPMAIKSNELTPAQSCAAFIIGAANEAATQSSSDVEATLTALDNVINENDDCKSVGVEKAIAFKTAYVNYGAENGAMTDNEVAQFITQHLS